MQIAFNVLTVLLPSFVIYQIRHSVYFSRMERLWLMKNSLCMRKANVLIDFGFLSLYHVLLLSWFILGLMQISYLSVVVSAISLHQGLHYWKKMSPSYYVIFLIDRLLAFFFLILFALNYFFNMDYLENIFWKRSFMFSIQFFLITFTVYCIIKLFKYFKK